MTPTPVFAASFHPAGSAAAPPQRSMRDQAKTDMAECRAALREGSYTFFAASLILPRAVREPASALYAFCRLADDAVDNGFDKHAAVARLRLRLDAAYSGHACPVAADRVLSSVVAQFAIPRALPEALLQGFEWDANGRCYESIEALQDYAARVAGSVGAMMALLMGVRSSDGLARACDLGVAMQLSNIARDVGEDARMGRLYLPLQWMREAGLEPQAWLARPVFNDQIAHVVRRVLLAAEGLYRRVDAGVAQLPLACRPGINAARFLYAEIGHEVARRGLDSVSQRAVVARSRKLHLLGRSVLTLFPASALQPAPCLAANQFLVDAAAKPLVLPSALKTHHAPVAAAFQGQVKAPKAAWWHLTQRLEDRAVWVIELFERLERVERHERLRQAAL